MAAGGAVADAGWSAGTGKVAEAEAGAGPPLSVFMYIARVGLYLCVFPVTCSLGSLSFCLSVALSSARSRFRRSSFFVSFHGTEHCCLNWCVGRTQRTNEGLHGKVLRSYMSCYHYCAFAMKCGQTDAT